MYPTAPRGTSDPIEASGRRWRADALLLLAVFATAGVLIIAGSLQAPFYWDDLHLIRVHTAAELAGAWAGAMRLIN